MGSFRISGPLGEGGYGAVYEAIDDRTDQRVALKELLQASSSALSHFKQEFRGLADLHHPNLVGLKGLFEHDGRWYIAMELIEGESFLEYVRPKGALDDARLRRALRGIAQGLIALHDYGFLHRDLKPSNVRVNREGNAVLLDFGLIASLDGSTSSLRGDMAGTIAFMAPEQIQGERVGREADWYGFGTCVYQALTNRLPFEGESTHIALQKLRKEPPPPSSIATDVPPDLDALCVALLSLEPAQRPNGEEVLRKLGGISTEQSRAEQGALPVQPLGTFAGRDAELELLEHALSRTHEGELRLVLVEGESGVGKSAMVEEFLRRQRERHPRSLALRGRCYENEQVPYKAFDGCIDELARELTRMDLALASALLPARASLLAQLFPVLRGVPALATARSVDASADPTVRRLEAFGALSQLLAKLAEDRPLILVIDDLQWADDESFRLLHALADDKSAPPVLILATVRPRQELDGAVLDQLELLRAWKCCDLVSLVGLPRMQAEALAQKLLAEQDEGGTWSRVIAAESRGHPLFLSELVHYRRSQDLRSVGALTLDAALEARVSRLEPRARELLEVVALAARPHATQLFARALGLPNVEESAKLLLSAKLLRARKAHEIGVFHDRIRHVVVGLIARARKPHLHRMLAQALADTLHEDSLEQARHWDLAGVEERAIRAYERAGEQALSTLAFARAEQHYARALTLMGSERDEYYCRLLVQRAHALGCAGRSADAATVYTEAAALARGEQAIRLRTRAAQHLLRSAQTEPGIRAAGSLLSELGITMPTSTGGALRHIAWTRVRMALRGNKFEARARQPDDEPELLTLDTLQELGMPLLFVEPAVGLALYMEHERRALANGDQAHVALAFANEAWFLAQRKSLAAAEPAFAQAYKLLQGLNQPAWIAYTAFAEGAACIIHWDLARAEQRLEQAHQILQTQCAGEPWLLTNVRLSLGGLWRNIGKHRRLAAQTEIWMSEARERKDLYTRAMLVGLGFSHMRHLMQDAPDKALSEIREAMEPIPREPSAYAHLGEYVASQQALLYAGGRGALDWLHTNEARHKGTFLFGTRLGKEVRALFSAMAALRACEQASASERSALLELSRTGARTLRRVGSPFAVAHSSLLMAQIFALEKQRDKALSAVTEARARFDVIGHVATRAAAYLQGTIEGGNHGGELREAALLAYQAQGWKEPFRGLALTVPALGLLHEQKAVRAKERNTKLIRDRYEVIRPLGSGGFGTVVEALDHNTGGHVALKELVRASAGALGRFKQEFRAMQDVHHPNVVRLDALFEEQGTWYIAMELVAGIDLISWVREAGELDRNRVTEAFAGLMRGVSALHEAGLVHRDINPGNVRVTADGRVVLLDFGLIARAHDARDARMVGTAEYVPPEQLDGHEPERAADVYAIGVCLYQALTGRLPFTAATPATFALRKRRDKLTPPSQLSPNIPADFDDLCVRMLAPEPRDRPTLAEVQLALSTRKRERTGKATVSIPVAGVPARAPFAGRDQELAGLLSTFDQTHQRGLALCIIEGESGLGKSALMAEFATRLQQRTPGLTVLRSRCYENEQIAFKAFDGVVDELSLMLSARDAQTLEALLPKRVALLAQLFPVLGMVLAVAEASKKGLPVEPSARRREAFRCFVELLAALAREQPLLLLLDDLQWADPESFELLHEIVSSLPRAELTIVCTVRPLSELEGPTLVTLRELYTLPVVNRIALSPLPTAAAEQLVRSLLGQNADESSVRRLTQESKGHPLFARELVEHKRFGNDAAHDSILTLDQALLARVERLPSAARELLEAVSILGKPYGSHLLARALGPEALQHDVLSGMLAHGLLRRRGDQQLGVSHDRMRRVVTDALNADKRRDLCRRLAEVLDREGADPVERARLWDEANDAERATDAYEQAGTRALEGLAFARAEQLLHRALSLQGDTHDERTQRLLVLRGHALARAGAGEEAARVYHQAAEHAVGDAKTRLRVWSAQQLIQSLHIEEGLKEAGELLGALNTKLPTGDLSALGRIAWERANMPMRSVDVLKRVPKTASASEQLLLDTLYDLMLPIYVTAPLPGSALTVRYLRRALSHGSLPHVARALGLECTLRSIRAPRANHELMIAQSMTLAERTGDPAVMAGVGLTLGTARIVQCRFGEARKHMERVHELVQTQCPGEPWMLTNARMHLGWIWNLTGEHALLREHLTAWLDEARERKDRFAYGIFASYGSATLRHLMNDDPAATLSELESAMAPWPDTPFGFPHLGEAAMAVQAHRYVGGDGALQYLERNKTYLDNRYVRLNPSARLLLMAARGTALLEAIDAPDGPRTHELLQRARKEAARALGIASPLNEAASNSLLAVIEAVSKRPERALQHIKIAEAIYTPRGHLQAQALRYLQGLLEGGEAGYKKRSDVLAMFAAQGWKKPARGLTMHLSALRVLEAQYG